MPPPGDPAGVPDHLQHREAGETQTPPRVLLRLSSFAHWALATLEQRWDTLPLDHPAEEEVFRTLVFLRLLTGHLEDNLPHRVHDHDCD